MKRLTSRFVALVAAIALPAGLAHAQAAPEETAVGDMKLRDFGAKWMFQQLDLPDLARYREANRALIASADPRPRVVLLGDSITFHWSADLAPAPPGINLINRGVAGQNTSMMLLRFEDDVVALKPAAVVILGGANDLRAFQGDPALPGPRMLETVARNLTAMADIADARKIKVVLCAIAPVGSNIHNRDRATLRKTNAWIREFAAQRGYAFVDYATALAGPDGDLPASLTIDGLHPNPAGYRAMWPKLEAALAGLKLGETAR